MLRKELRCHARYLVVMVHLGAPKWWRIHPCLCCHYSTSFFPKEKRLRHESMFKWTPVMKTWEVKLHTAVTSASQRLGPGDADHTKPNTTSKATERSKIAYIGPCTVWLWYVVRSDMTNRNVWVEISPNPPYTKRAMINRVFLGVVILITLFHNSTTFLSFHYGHKLLYLCVLGIRQK